jgi:hypothetical protein
MEMEMKKVIAIGIALAIPLTTSIGTVLAQQADTFDARFGKWIEVAQNSFRPTPEPMAEQPPILYLLPEQTVKAADPTVHMWAEVYLNGPWGIDGTFRPATNWPEDATARGPATSVQQ